MLSFSAVDALLLFWMEVKLEVVWQESKRRFRGLGNRGQAFCGWAKNNV